MCASMICYIIYICIGLYYYKKNLQASYPSAVAAFGSRQMVRLCVVDSLGFN